MLLSFLSHYENFQRLLQARHKTKTVIGSSADRVCFCVLVVFVDLHRPLLLHPEKIERKQNDCKEWMIIKVSILFVRIFFVMTKKKNTRKLETQIVFDLISIVNNNKEKGAQFKRRNCFNVPCK